MKKIVKGAISAAIAIMSVFGLVGCKEKIISAYDIAVKNGFVGTEQEWLASLEGADGKDAEQVGVQELYEAAVADGFQGSMSDFIREYLSLDMNEDNNTETIAQNLSSVVSVCCAFTKTESKTVKGYGSMGSGVIIDLDKKNGNALIVTNYHVLFHDEADAENGISDCIYIYPYGARNHFTIGMDVLGRFQDVNKDGKKNSEDQGDFDGDGIRARFIGGAMDYDVALLEVSGSEFLKNNAVSEAKIGDSNAVTVGEKAFVIGNANGDGHSVTSGVISVDSEIIEMESLVNENKSVEYRVLRTDAAVNHGNSGGGLFNAQGELIGITNAKNVEEETDNMGYALPSRLVQYLCDNIQDNGGVVERAMLGIYLKVEAVQVVMGATGKLEVYETIAVTQASGITGAAYGKLKVGDIFRWISINGGERIEITREYQISDELLRVRMGDKVQLGMLRDGEEITVELTYNRESYFTTYA